ncbi:MAG: hypothetical protein LUQ07_08405 [Methanospirillum sp.]|nr:hypothetical protein [Methanospirillum sp.]
MYRLILATGLAIILIAGVVSGDTNMSGTWNTTGGSDLIRISDDGSTGSWIWNTTGGQTEDGITITPVDGDSFIVVSDKKGISIAVISPDELNLYNLSEAGSTGIPLSYRFTRCHETANTTDRGMFLSGFSTGVGASQEEQQTADSAGIEGNERFDSNSQVSCDDKICTCDGETCVCSGPDCQCEGKDCVKAASGYSCSGWDCWFTCRNGEDCKILGS